MRNKIRRCTGTDAPEFPHAVEEDIRLFLLRCFGKSVRDDPAELSNGFLLSS